MIYDKLPPHDADLEAVIIGTFLVDSEALKTCEYITEEMFYVEKYRTVMSAIRRLQLQKVQVDIVTVVTEMKRCSELDQIGGALFVSRLTDRIGSAAHIDTHGRVLHQKWLLREIYRIAAKVQQRSFVSDCDALQLLEQLQLETMLLQKTITRGKEPQHIAEIVKNEISAYQHRLEALAKGITAGIDTGLSDLNNLIGGWQDSDLIIIAARPGMGKTSLAMLNALAAAKSGANGAIFSMEMSALQLVQRALIMEASVYPDTYKKAALGNGEITALNMHRDKMSRLGIHIDDTPSMSIGDLKSKARNLKQKHNIKWIIVDYLQLMKGDSNGWRGNRETEISSISQGLKAIAKELNIPVIALSQLSRAVEQRGGDMRPKLSDLRESGAIEQDADMVIFLHRPEYYNITEDGNGNSTSGLAEVIVAKYRSGATGIINCRWIGHFTRFEDQNKPSPTFTPNDKFLNSIHSDNPF